MTFNGTSPAKVLPMNAFGSRFASVGSFSWQFVGPYSSSTVKGEELGNGRAYRKGKAQDEAAQMAFEALSSNPPPKLSALRRRNSFP